MRIVTILSLLPFIANAQCKETVFTEKDLTKNETSVGIINKKANVSNADENCVAVKFSFTANKRQYSYTTLSSVNLMLSQGNAYVMASMKNKYTYSPKNISIIYDEKLSRWVTRVEYVAQNDYGALKNGVAKVKFLNDGTYDEIEF